MKQEGEEVAETAGGGRLLPGKARPTLFPFRPPRHFEIEKCLFFINPKISILSLMSSLATLPVQRHPSLATLRVLQNLYYSSPEC